LHSFDPILATLLAPIVGFAAAAFLPWSVQALLLPSSFASGGLGNWLTETAFLVGGVGALAAMFYWLLGLQYVARPSIQRRLLPPRLLFPAGLSRDARDNLTLNIYWHSRISSAVKFAAMYPWWFFAVVVASSSSNSSSGSSGSSQSTPTLLLSLILLLALSVTLIPAMAVARPIEFRTISAKVCQELCLFLQPNESDNQRDEDRFPDLIVDPLGSRRLELAEVAMHLADAARQLDARQKRGFSPHPISTLLRAVSRVIREFLSNERSLRILIPHDLTELLSMTLSMLGTHYDEAVYHCLIQQVSAFDERGNPTVDAIERPPSRAVRLMSFTTSGIPKIALVVTSIAAIAAISMAVALALLHRMNLNELLRYLRPQG
jgi:hypothetical protein